MNIQILTKRQCTECNGEGVVSNPEWQKFYEADEMHKHETGSYMDIDMYKDWWQKNGYYSIPREEHPCAECEGVGHIEKWMEATELFNKHLKSLI